MYHIEDKNKQEFIENSFEKCLFINITKSFVIQNYSVMSYVNTTIFISI